MRKQNSFPTQQLPKTAKYLTVIAAAFALLTSLLGLFDPSIYAQETENWVQQARRQVQGRISTPFTPSSVSREP